MRKWRKVYSRTIKKNIKRVILAKEGIVDNRNSCFSQSFLCLPSQVSADSIGGGDLKSLDDAVVKVRETGYFEVRTKKDRFLLGGDFGKPNEKGELWSTCNYKNKNYCVRLTWQKGVLDRRNKFTKL